MCVCGHPDHEHHTSIRRDGRPSYGECCHYGFNETGGMKQTWTGWFFYHALPPDMWGRLRDFARRVPGLRGPWYKTHCMTYRQAG